ncbi:esterase/lipase family protein [Bosea thiooxidans]
MSTDTTLTQINQPKSPICDIVFVHGLDGDAHGTWQHAANNDRDYWPRWIADDLPEAAVWTVGYDASALAWLGAAMPITQRANNLLALMEAYGIGSRPLTFVTHSMGGLIVKQMMRAAEGLGVEEFSAFVRQTRLIVFVSVPHHGSFIANYLDALRVLFRPSAAAKDLRATQPNLFDLNQWFREFVKRHQVRVVSFHEETETSGALIVSRESADFGYPGHISIGETLDHIAICKPRDRNSLVALRTGAALQQFVRSVAEQKCEPLGASHGNTGPRLRYKRTTLIDPECVEGLLASSDHASITYFDDISEALEKLRERDRTPAVLMRSYPLVGDPSAHGSRELRAAREHADNSDLLTKAEATAKRTAERLDELRNRLRSAGIAGALGTKALTTFAALAALKLIQILKNGFDWSDGNPQPWFESFKFNSDPSYCLFDWVPRKSDTGRLVFGYRQWVGARVGHENRYEYAMFPLKVVLPLFREGTRGDREAFYGWILPQLVLNGSHQPIDGFPHDDWEAFLLEGAHPKEWWSRHHECPWPDSINGVNMIEL